MIYSYNPLKERLIYYEQTYRLMEFLQKNSPYCHSYNDTKPYKDKLEELGKELDELLKNEGL